MGIKVNDVIEHRHWGQGVVKKISGSTVFVEFMIQGEEDWNLWVLNKDIILIER